jgi:hypothetical protein
MRTLLDSETCGEITVDICVARPAVFALRDFVPDGCSVSSWALWSPPVWAGVGSSATVDVAAPVCSLGMVPCRGLGVRSGMVRWGCRWRLSTGG